MNKVLVANRGEIAVRILRTLKEMGISTVAVYSEADRQSLHVRMAEEAILLGPAPSAQSYLKGDYIIEKCLELGVDGIHPGFGFLSENAVFAQKVAEAGINFIGPSAHSMEIMGSKLAAKEAVAKFNVPLVPGTATPITDVAEAKKLASEIGFPILIKASAGGGGKGMRIVEKEDEFIAQMETAVRESVSSFGDGAVFIEKYVSSPRHIEIQVLGDKYGNYVYFFERECSIQRRHQKVIEEAPSSALSPEIRQQMGEAAINVAKSCNYFSVGTVEFIMDEKKDFYFLEMNTRLQVEHPISEMITGKDLVEEQIKVARGEALSYTQEDLKINGHAIELRVYAEDPLNNFLPDIGTLHTYRIPSGPGIRVDDCCEEGMTIPIYYDPMIAKLIVHATDRKAALRKMVRAIDEYRISGVANTLAFGKWVMQHPQFIAGEIDTHFIQRYFTKELSKSGIPQDELLALEIGANLWHLLSSGNGENNIPKENNISYSLWYSRRKVV